jgi:hypothetical protein
VKMGGVVGLACVCSSLLCSIVPVRADGPSVVINEILFDPAGADDGCEFIELFNRGGHAVVLHEWSLESGNGNREGNWKLEWCGSKLDTIPPRGFFVIGEDQVFPEPDFIATLDLQNGPDGCRLTDPAGLADVVGWGDLVFDEYFEGEPAVDAKSGCSIGRDPDGSDTGLNRADFRDFAVPSPGSYNHPPKDLMALALGLSRDRPMLASEIELVCRVHNAGTEPCGQGAMLVAEVGGRCDSAFILEDLLPGSTVGLTVRLDKPGAGIHGAVAWHSCRDDKWHGNDTVRTSIVFAPPPLVVNEIMFKPDGRDCEWIELLNASDGVLDLAGWTLEDSRGKAGPIADGDLVVSGGDFLILVEDREVFGAVHPDISEQTYERPAGGWPSLNDADGPLGFADAVVIRDGFGSMVDSVAYCRSWCSPGRSVERIDPAGATPDPANWSPHFGKSGSSPGAPNSVSFHLPTAGKALSLSPRTFSPDGDGEDDLVAVTITLPGRGLVRVRVFDVNGRPVRRLIDGDVVDSGRVTFWDGTCDDGSSAATGLYLLLFEARMQASERSFRAKSPLVLIRR